MAIDLNTLLLATLFAVTVLSALKMTYILAVHFHDRAVRWWTAGQAFWAIAALSYLFRPIMDQALSIFLANLSLFVGTACLTLGVCAFVNRRLPLRFTICFIGVASAAIAFWSSPESDLLLRIIVIAFVNIVLLGLAIGFLLSDPHKSSRIARIAVISVFLIYITGELFAQIILPIVAIQIPFTTQSTLRSVWLAMNIAAQVLLPSSLLLLVSERLLRDTKRLARYDGLTGILNRQAFLERADQEIARVARHKSAATLLMLDIDHFKIVNDSYGHMVGDEVLRAVALNIKETLRREDVFCRYGGEEFCILAPGISAVEAFSFGERIRLLIADSSVATHRGAVKVTVSIGAAPINPNQPDISQTLKIADEALYVAKRNGRNAVWLATTN